MAASRGNLTGLSLIFFFDFSILNIRRNFLSLLFILELMSRSPCPDSHKVTSEKENLGNILQEGLDGRPDQLNQEQEDFKNLHIKI